MKLYKAVIFFVLLLIWLSIPGFSFYTEKQYNLTLPLEGIESLEIDCGAGYLNIKGIEGIDQIEVTAHLVVKNIDDDKIDDFKRKHVKLSLEKISKKAILISKTNKSSNLSIFSLFKSQDSRIDLDIRIPKNMILEIDDGSGDIELIHMNSKINIDDGSGNISMEDINGNILIDDGSGSIDLEKIKGNLRLDDGSGNIKITNIQGDVDIDDGSGSIRVYQIVGSVTIDDGSGSIEIEDVEKDVIIKSAGSGGLKIRNVKGKVKQ